MNCYQGFRHQPLSTSLGPYIVVSGIQVSSLKPGDPLRLLSQLIVLVPHLPTPSHTDCAGHWTASGQHALGGHWGQWAPESGPLGLIHLRVHHLPD